MASVKTVLPYYQKVSINILTWKKTLCMLTGFLINRVSPFEVDITAGKPPNHYSQLPVSWDLFIEKYHKNEVLNSRM